MSLTSLFLRNASPLFQIVIPAVSRLGFPCRGLSRLIALAVLAGIPLTAQAEQPAAVAGNAVQVKPGAAVPGRYIVVLRGRVSDSRAAAADMAGRYGLGVGFVYSSALRGFSAAVPDAALAGLRRDPRVAFVEPDRIARAIGQSTATGISRIGASGNPEITIDGVDDRRVNADIAIIDSGIDLSHPDLNVYRAADCASGGAASQICVEGAGNDGHGHGTHVAGIAGALDNGLGVVGVAPGARLWAVRVLNDTGSGYVSWVIAGIDWVTAHSADVKVANLSITAGNSDSLCQAVSNATTQGVTVIAAAGNAAEDAANTSPANCTDAITVSAAADFDGRPGALGSPTCRTDQDDTLADFSNWGAAIDIAAPGVCILSTNKAGGYGYRSGTSMAAPHVAGAAALLVSAGAASPQQVEDTILSNGTFDWTDESGDGVREPLLNVGEPLIFSPVTVASNDPASFNAPPGVAISSPAQGASFVTGSEISFQGTAADAEDGDMTALLNWYANGVLIGSGGGFTHVLADGNYSIRAEVTDSGGITRGSTIDITVAPTMVGVADPIGCVLSGGKRKDRNLGVVATVIDPLGATVPNASVSVTITHDAGAFWGSSGVTGADGTVAFTIRNAKAGTYVTRIDGITGGTIKWDGTQPQGNSCVK